MSTLDRAGVAESLFAVSATGSRLAVKLYTLVNDPEKTHSRVKAISDDVRTTSNMLQLLGKTLTLELANTEPCILSQTGLETLQTLINKCEKNCEQLNPAATEFSCPDSLVDSLCEVKDRVMLILEVMNLALWRRASQETASENPTAQQDIYRLQLAVHEQEVNRRPNAQLSDLDLGDSVNDTQEPAPDASWDTMSSSSESSAMTPTPPAASDSSIPMEKNSFVDLPLSHASTLDSTKSTEESGPAGEVDPKSTKTQPEDVVPDEYHSSQHGKATSSGSIVKEIQTEKRTLLHLYLVKPSVRDDYDGVFLSWSVHEMKVPQSDIQEHLTKNREEGLPTVLDAYPNLSRHEHEAIRIQLEQWFRSSLISLKRTYTDLMHRGIVIDKVPVLQFVLMNEVIGEELPRIADTNVIRETDLSRPTYIKVHRKFMSPDTLDVYNLPWHWDPTDPDYMIIQRWISESDQEILFEHTRRLRKVKSDTKIVDLLGESYKVNGKEDGSLMQRTDCITLKDPLLRTLVFPFRLCSTWAGISDLLTEAFRSVDPLNTHVAGGRYDLVNTKGEIILPYVWNAIIEPGVEIVMHMWPMADGQNPIGNATFGRLSPESLVETLAVKKHTADDDQTANVNMHDKDRGKARFNRRKVRFSPDGADDEKVRKVVDELLEKYTTLSAFNRNFKDVVEANHSGSESKDDNKDT
ncbi:MAG: hypothetical protein Q9182_002836 [Xanthomendoza sp. 2 TL-2023]